MSTPPRTPSPARQAAGRKAAERRAWLRSSDRTCGFCGHDGADTVDHITPLARGGTDDPSNWRPAHRSCNSRGGARITNAKKARARAQRADLERAEGGRVLRGAPNPARESTPNPSNRRAVAPVAGRGGESVVQLPDAAPIAVRPTVRGGMVLPRLETPRAPGVRSWGEEAAAMAEASGIVPGGRLRAWQRYALRRALELRGGRLRWRVVIVTTSRQSGKSWLLRAAAWWRLHQEERFGEPQTLLHLANKERTAREVWRPAARLADEVYGRGTSKYGAGREEVELPSGSRYLVQAATANAGVGWSLSHAFLDEAWNIERTVLEDAVMPALSEREQPQVWLVSTAGDSSSDLLRAYRSQALQDRDGSGEILLLEWSAPPEAPYDEEGTWRWASPEWSPRRREFLRGRCGTITEQAFRTQYLNQWVQAVDGWMPPAVFARGARTTRPPEVLGPPLAAAVEVSPDGTRYAVVRLWEAAEGAVWVESDITLSPSRVWRALEEERPRLLYLPPNLAVHYTGRLRPQVVGAQELQRHLIGVGRAVQDGRVLWHAEDHNLRDHVTTAVATTTESGALRLSTKRSPGPIEAARALVWVVGEHLRPSQPRPRIVTR